MDFFNRRYVTDTITNLGKQIFFPDFKFSDYTLSKIGKQKFGRYAKKTYDIYFVQSISK